MPGKKGRGHRAGTSGRQRGRRVLARTPVLAVDPEELWRLRRAGARNIAGVAYQVLVTAQILIDGYRGASPFVATVVPEGFEDIDCGLFPGQYPGNRLLVQVKEH